jgi:predicted ABC-type ATPase
MPRCLIIAGPNGAGKTTFALEYLLGEAGITRFLNADMIASGLSPFAPEDKSAMAGRLFLEEVEAAIQAKDDFAFETTLSGRGYLKLIDRLREEGWLVELHYIALPSADFSKSRVAERVRHGGHNIPASDISRRFPRSLRNLLNDYRMRVDRCLCYMGGEGMARPVFRQKGSECVVYDDALFETIKALAEQS